MNKQELIDKWENETGTPTFETRGVTERASNDDMYTFGYGVARKEILEDLKQLDEPKKPKTEVFNHDEKFVVEWLDHTTEYHYSLYSALKVAGSEVRSWMKIGFNSNRFARAFMSMDYEVEKEPLYYIKLPSTYNTFLVESDDGDLIVWQNTDKGTPFTEKRIKEIDERYWPFAVPVEEVVEG